MISGMLRKTAGELLACRHYLRKRYDSVVILLHEHSIIWTEHNETALRSIAGRCTIVLLLVVDVRHAHHNNHS